jgi:hypothetical protein
MFASAQRSPETSADYARETSRLVAQYFCENPQDEPRAPLVQTANWFLNSHGRWAQNTIRGFAAALHQEMGSVLDYDTFDPDSEEASILWRLKNERPDPVSKTKKSKKTSRLPTSKRSQSRKRSGRNIANRFPCASSARSSVISVLRMVNFRFGSLDISCWPRASDGALVKFLFCSVRAAFCAPGPKSKATSAG